MIIAKYQGQITSLHMPDTEGEPEQASITFKDEHQSQPSMAWAATTFRIANTTNARLGDIVNIIIEEKEES